MILFLVSIEIPITKSDFEFIYPAKISKAQLIVKLYGNMGTYGRLSTLWAAVRIWFASIRTPEPRYVLFSTVRIATCQGYSPYLAVPGGWLGESLIRRMPHARFPGESQHHS